MNPDSLGDWQARRHGIAPPNMPRKLTSVTVTFDPGRGTYHLSGDNGTSLLNIYPDSGLHKAAAALFATLD